MLDSARDWLGAIHDYGRFAGACALLLVGDRMPRSVQRVLARFVK